MAENGNDPLYERLQAYVGQSLSKEGPQPGPDPVNMPMIHHWIDAFDDRNPVYEDEEFAASTRFGGVVAPFAMMQTWTMHRPRLEGIAERGGAAMELDPEGPLSLLDREGYTATLATNSELEFDRSLRPGDEVIADARMETISERKKTGLGYGYFVTWVTTYTDQRGEIVGRQSFRILKFNPHTMGDA